VNSFLKEQPSALVRAGRFEAPLPRKTDLRPAPRAWLRALIEDRFPPSGPDGGIPTPRLLEKMRVWPGQALCPRGRE